MAIKRICDNCGSDALDVDRATFDIAVGSTHDRKNLPNFDGELCDVCFKRIIQVMAAILPRKIKA